MLLRYEKYFFYGMVLLALSIIVIPKFYITGDGPSHTYNSKVLFDYIFGRDRSNYEQFYTINRNLDPNWIGHLIIGFFMQIFPYWLADKLFQISYILLFAFGFRYCIKSISTESSFLSFVFFPFVFTLAFQQGFYNYSLAIAMLCWCIGYFIRIRHHLDQPGKQFVLSVMLLLMAFAHGMPVLYTILIMILIWVSENAHIFIPLDFRKISLHLSRLALIFMPALLTIFLFILRRSSVTQAHHLSVLQKFKQFLTLHALQSTRHNEKYPAVALGLMLVVFLFVLIFTRIKVNIPKKIHISYVFLVMTMFTFFSFLFSPGTIGYAGSISIRLAFLPFMFFVFYFATKRWSDLSKVSFIGLSFTIACAFLVIRFPYVMRASKIGKEIMSASPFIEKNSVLLNIHFDDYQRLNSHNQVFQKDGSFIHFSDYLGAIPNKNLVLINNYEAELNYFPVNWQAGKNPRTSIPSLIDGNTPCDDYQRYEKQIGRKIDYIIFQNWHKQSLLTPCVKSMIDGINQGFLKIYESKNQYIIVFKRR